VPRHKGAGGRMLAYLQGWRQKRRPGRVPRNPGRPWKRGREHKACRPHSEQHVTTKEIRCPSRRSGLGISEAAHHDTGCTQVLEVARVGFKSCSTINLYNCRQAVQPLWASVCSSIKMGL
jgi:hypothetical protein